MELGGGVREDPPPPAASGPPRLGHAQGSSGDAGHRTLCVCGGLGSVVMHLLPHASLSPLPSGQRLWPPAPWEAVGRRRVGRLVGKKQRGKEGTPVFSAGCKSNGHGCWPRAGLIFCEGASPPDIPSGQDWRFLLGRALQPALLHLPSQWPRPPGRALVSGGVEGQERPHCGPSASLGLPEGGAQAGAVTSAKIGGAVARACGVAGVRVCRGEGCVCRGCGCAGVWGYRGAGCTGVVGAWVCKVWEGAVCGGVWSCRCVGAEGVRVWGVQVCKRAVSRDVGV